MSRTRSVQRDRNRFRRRRRADEPAMRLEPLEERLLLTAASGPVIGLNEFRLDSRFSGYDGSGYSVAVLDTGVDLDHPFFGADADEDGISDRIVYQYDFGDGDDDASDYHSRGSNIASVVASEDMMYKGVAPGVDLIALKVYGDDGECTFTAIEQALQWLIDNAETYNLVAVNLPVGDGENWTASGSHYDIGDEIASLTAMSVAVVAPAGDDYYTHDSAVGVAYPAADPNTIGVGATYDSGTYGWGHSTGAQAYSSAVDRITAFSQRHADLVDIFAPGSQITGANRLGGTVPFHGTAQAAAHVSGSVALIQQVAEQEIGRRLTVGELRGLMQSTGTEIVDGDDEDDNVVNTGLTFQRIDVFDMAEGVDEIGRAMYFDFGTADSPVADGYNQVTESTTYHAFRGYGWTNGTIDSRDRGTGTDLTRDFNYTAFGTFSADVVNDTYGVTITFGDQNYYRDTMKVYIEGVYKGIVSALAGEPVTRTFEGTVTDGQLDVKFVDVEGTSLCVMVDAMAIERGGPRVVEATPAGELLGPVSSATFTFNESIIESSFTAEDVSISGPNGDVAVSSVTRLSDMTYQVDFASQSAVGTYTITVGPSIGDVGWNAMDQDGDGTLGEATDDQYVLTFDIVPLPTSYDFGTADSPLAADSARVADDTPYSADTGYGWLSGTISSRNRATGTDLGRDFCYTADGTFVADTGNGAYEVTLTLGDMDFYRTNMQVYIEGALVGTVAVPDGEPLAFTYDADVSDGQLTVRLVNPAGIVCINGLSITERAPIVESSTPETSYAGPLDHVTLTFSEAIADGSFTLDDVVGFYNESGLIPVTSVQKVSDLEYRVNFETQTAEGTYTLVVGPDILSTVGVSLDQDGDGTPGESIEDRFTLAFTLAAIPTQYDFGTAESPLAAGYARVTPDDAFSEEAGYGWLTGTIDARDRETGTDTTRDFNFTSDGTFAVNVTPDTYDVSITLGDMGYSFRDDMRVYIEGELVDTVTTWTGITHTDSYSVACVDGRLDIQFFDDDGLSQWVMVDAITLTTSGPRVLEMSPDVTGTDPVDRIVLTFTEEIADGSFTLDDVVGVTGPGGAISATAVNRLSGTQYEVTFDEQISLGAYAITIGPDILDVGGHAMDSDEDGTLGEALEDRYTGQFTLQLVPTAFDFGTGSSPVAEGFTQVAPGDVYSDAVGFGWTSGTIGAIDRVDEGGGTDRTRDFNHTPDGTFEVKLADGAYKVTVTVGDLGYSYRDSMGVFLEGQLVDTVTTWTGIVHTATYEVVVSDGALTLRLADQGGIDPYCMIESLEIESVGAAKFDFGTPSSPVAEGYAGIDHQASYTPWRGYGWLEGDIDSRDRATGSDAKRDFCYTTDGTFVVDVPNGTYLVALTLGDMTYHRSGMKVYTEGQLVDTVTTNAGEPLTRTYEVTVADGQLTLHVEGVDPDLNPVMIDALRISGQPSASAFDFGTNGSAVMTDYIGVNPDSEYDGWAGYGWTEGDIDSRDRGLGDDRTGDFCFSEDATFTVDCLNGTYDVTITVGDLAYSWRDDMRLYLEGVLVDTVTTWTGIIHTDTYQVTVTDGQLDLRLYDPDGLSNIVCIESLSFTEAGGAGATTTEPVADLLAAGETLTLDFGTHSSTVADGAECVTSDTNYRQDTGIGLVDGQLAAAVDDPNDPLNGDCVIASDATLGIEAADGTYTVSLTVADDGSQLGEDLVIELEGQVLAADSVLASDGLVTYTFGVDVSDGRIELHVDDGGTGRSVRLYSAEITAA